MSYQPYSRNAKGLVFFGDAGSDALLESQSTLTFGANDNDLQIPDGKYIGSQTTHNAIQIAGDGDITTIAGLTIGGDLTVNGTTTTVNSTTVTIDDPIFTLGGDTAPSSDDGKDRGIEFRYFDGTAKLGFFGYDNSTDKFTLLTDATNLSEVFSGTKATLTANLDGVASEATALETARNFSLTGEVTAAAVSFDGQGNVALSAALASSAITGQAAKTSAASNDLLLIADSADSNALKKITKGQFISDLGGGTMSSFTLSDGLNTQTIEDSNTLTATGGQGITTAVSATDTLTISLHSSIAGTGLNLTGNTLDVQIDSSTIDINGSSQLYVPAGGITQTELATSVAGNGLAGGGGSALSVNVDGSTLEINTDSLRVKDLGITFGKLATAAYSTSVGAGSNTVLATTSAVKAYVDAQVDTADELSELADTNISLPAAGHVLIYDATAGVWDNATLTAGSNVTITNGDGSITIASTDTNTTYTGGNGLTLSGTDFSVNVDDSSIEINADTLRVKALGITNAMLAGSIANAKLSNSAITIAGVSTSLGGSITADTIAGAISAGTIANSQLANSSVNFGGVSLSLGGSDTTPAFDLTDATNYPTSSLVGTITNAQLAGSIANAKLANSSVNFGGVTVALGASDTTPAFDLSDATNYRFGSLTRVVNSSAITADASVSNDVSLVDSSSAAVTMTLPTPSAGLFYTIKKIDSSANSVIVDAGTGSATLDGGANFTLYHQYETVSCVCDGTNWHIV